MNNLHFDDSSLTINTDEFIDLNTALLEEELRSLNATPEYNKISLKSIDTHEAERIRRSLVTPVPQRSSASKQTASPEFHSFLKSPTNSCYAESIALFRNLSDQDNNILDFAYTNLDEIMKNIDLEDDVTLLHQENSNDQNTSSYNYTNRVPQSNNIQKQPVPSASINAPRDQSTKRPATNRYSIDADGLSKLQQQQQKASNVKRLTSSFVLKPLDTSIAVTTNKPRPVAAYKAIKNVPSRTDNMTKQQTDKRRWSSYIPEQGGSRQMEAPVINRLASLNLAEQSTSVQVPRRNNAINTATPTKPTHNTVTTATKKPIKVAVKRMSSLKSDKPKLLASLLHKNNVDSTNERERTQEDIDQYNQRIALLNKTDMPTAAVKKRASIHGYLLFKQQEHNQQNKNAVVSETVIQSENERKLQRRHTVRFNTTQKERNSFPLAETENSILTTTPPSNNYPTLLDKRSKRLSFQGTATYDNRTPIVEPSARHQHHFSFRPIIKKEVTTSTVTQQHQRRQRALSVPGSHSNLQLKNAVENRPTSMPFDKTAAAEPSSSTIRYRKSMIEPSQHATTTLLSSRFDPPQVGRFSVLNNNENQQSNDLHLLPSESSSGFSNSTASSSSYTSGRGDGGGGGVYRDPPTPPTHAALITSTPAYIKRNSMPLMDSNDIPVQQLYSNSNKFDHHRYNRHLGRISEVNTAPSSDGYSDVYDILNLSPPPAFFGTQDHQSDEVGYHPEEEEEVYNNYDATSPVFYHTLPRRQHRPIPAASEDIGVVYNTLPRRHRVIADDGQTYNKNKSQVEGYDPSSTKYHSTAPHLNHSTVTTSDGYRNPMRSSAIAEYPLPPAVPAHRYDAPSRPLYDRYATDSRANTSAKRLSRKLSAEYVTESAKKVLASIQERRKNELYNVQKLQRQPSAYYTR
ncbi:hypothetical protein BDF20DRAFT_287527 [Mycotypha africana]|uniref:uncharacterized protein n=1 Tax=Mycotypha africana TaxID=64632 RepID=UPI0022FFFB0F|nr:uncharacterized protein BDF20DRAFT_287527 [Mycotypha africana]KAI8987760.1 hypothetical protein BDF20DRAFT_287527 [Mycotypha africana]